jgi:large subunit ribosomal protein L16
MRGRIRGNATRGNTVAFGEYGLQALDPGWVTARQIEAGRVAVTHFLHREGKVYIRIFPDKPISGKPLEVRMGKGKGETKDWVAVVKPGTVLFEIAGVDENTAKDALRRAAMKMPVRCRMLHRRHTL